MLFYFYFYELKLSRVFIWIRFKIICFSVSEFYAGLISISSILYFWEYDYIISPIFSPNLPMYLQVHNPFYVNCCIHTYMRAYKYVTITCSVHVLFLVCICFQVLIICFSSLRKLFLPLPAFLSSLGKEPLDFPPFTLVCMLIPILSITFLYSLLCLFSLTSSFTNMS